MENLCSSSLAKSNLLKLNDKNITYQRQAKTIFENTLKNETSEEKVIREISSYAFAIGEEILEKKIMAVIPTGCGASAF